VGWKRTVALSAIAHPAAQRARVEDGAPGRRRFPSGMTTKRRERVQCSLFDVVVGGFAGDDYVVDVGFTEAGAGEADEFGFGLELFDGGAA